MASYLGDSSCSSHFFFHRQSPYWQLKIILHFRQKWNYEVGDGQEKTIWTSCSLAESEFQRMFLCLDSCQSSTCLCWIGFKVTYSSCIQFFLLLCNWLALIKNVENWLSGIIYYSQVWLASQFSSNSPTSTQKEYKTFTRRFKSTLCSSRFFRNSFRWKSRCKKYLISIYICTF